ncbi:MAG: hypothetical protein ACFB5Z_01680 [Elainellaceae cyanobacterium]
MAKIESISDAGAKKFVITAVIVAAALLRFSMMTNHSLWFDEGLSLARIDGEDLNAIISNLNYTKYDKYQPAYFVALFFWKEILGDSDAVIRSLSAVFGTLSVLFTTLTALKIYGKNHALWTAIVISFSSFHIYYSQEARAYALIMFIAALELYLFSNLIFGKSNNRLVSSLLFWVTTAVGCLSSLFIVIFVISVCLSHLLSAARNIKQWTVFWLPLLLCLLPGIFLYLASSHSSNFTLYLKTWYGTHILENFLFVVYGMLAGTTYSVPISQLRYDQIRVIFEYWPHVILLFLSISLILFGVAGNLLRSLQDKMKCPIYRANFFFSTFIGVAFLISAGFAVATSINWAPRHSSHIFPAIAILIPSSFCYPKPEKFWEKLSKNLGCLGVVLLIAINIYSLTNYFFDPAHARDDYRSVAEYVTRSDNSKSAAALLWGDVELLRHYGDMKTVKVPAHKIDSSDLSEVLSFMTDGSQEVITIINRKYLLKYSVENALSDRYSLQSEKKFTYFHIYEFEKK